MKRTLLLIVILLTLTGCAQMESVPTATNSPIPPTATSTLKPTSTPTPILFYLEDSILYNLDENTGKYLEIGRGIVEISNVAGVFTAKDEKGKALFALENGEWVELEKVYYYGMEAISDVQAMAVGKLGMNLHDTWLYMIKTHPIYISGIGYGDRLYLHFMGLGVQRIDLSKREGFRAGDELLCGYLYLERSSTGEVYTVPVPLIGKWDGKLKIISFVAEVFGPADEIYPAKEYNWGEDDYEKAVQYFEEKFLPGTLIAPNIQTNWESQSISGFIGDNIENINKIMPSDYKKKINRTDGKFEVLEAIYEIKYADGLFVDILRIIPPDYGNN